MAARKYPEPGSVTHTVTPLVENRLTTQCPSLEGEHDSLLIVVGLSSQAGQPGQMSLLSDKERHRASRLVRLDDRRTFIAAHTLKRLVLAAVTRVSPHALEFYDNAHGKPHLDGQNGVYFNLSHTRGMVAFAYSRVMDVGVDIEFLGPNIYDRAMAAMTLTPDEILSVERAADPNHAFLLYWTAKEAVMKAEGKGMSMAMRDIHVFNGTADTHSNHWKVWHYLPSGQHILAFARHAAIGAEPAYSALPCLVMEEAALWLWADDGKPPSHKSIFLCYPDANVSEG